MSAILNFRVNGGTIRCASNLTIPANTVRHARAKFIFDEDWSDYSVKVATFTNELTGYVRRAILDENDLCVIPPEVLLSGGTLTIDLEGRVTLTDDTSAIARATTQYTIRLIETNVHTDGSEDIMTETPDILTKVLENIELIEQYAAASQSAQENAQRAAESAQAADETERRVSEAAETLTQEMSDAVAAAKESEENAKASENAATEKADASEQSASDAAAAADRAEAAAATVDVFPNTINEVTAARTALDGTVFDQLTDRLDVMEERIENGGGGSGDVSFENLDLIEENGRLYVYDSAKEVTNGEGWEIRGTGGGGGGSVLRLSNATGSSSVSLAYGETCELSYNFSSLDSLDNTPTGNGTAVYTVNDEKVATVSIAQGLVTFDATPYLVQGDNIVKVTVTDSFDASKSLTWTVKAVAISISSTFDPFRVYSDAIILTYTPIGSGISKTTHFEIDGVEIGTTVIATTNRQQTYTIPAQTHGAHTLRIYMTAEIEGVSIKSNELYYEFIFAVSGQTAPIIASSFQSQTITQYSTVSIPYYVYDPADLTANIELRVDGSVFSLLTVDRTEQSWDYRPTVSGVQELSIVCGDVSKTFTLTVQDIGIEIQPFTTGLAVDLNPYGQSNDSVDRDIWGFTNADGEKTAVQFSDGFDWDNGGFGTDEDGAAYIKIKAGDTITVPYYLFSQDARENGKYIKMIFKAENVADYDATVMSCMSGGRGLQVNAQNASLSSEQTTIDARYMEERRIELEFIINAGSGDRFMMAWLRGVPSRVKIYPTTDGFRQTTPVYLTIGSDDCDVKLYLLKVNEVAPSRYEVLDNFIADAPTSEEMIERYTRNNIYDDEGNIVISKLPSDLRVNIWKGERMTTGKTDTVTMDWQHKWPAHPEKEFTAYDVKVKSQGTTSSRYGEAGLNLDANCEKGFTNNDGEVSEAYSMTDDAIGVSYFNIKVNIASSENANNVCLADDYNNYQPYLRPQRVADSRVRDTVQGEPCVNFFYNTTTGETSFYGIGDLNNSKKNYTVFGQDTEQYPRQCCVEFLNNTSAHCRWKSADMSNWADDFEFRYPSKPSEQNLADFERVLKWVVSTDRTAATGEALDEAITYGNIRYTHDTADYRAAKFKAEFEDYFIKDSVLYHKLFTESHLMVDNIAKNTFPATEDGIHWHFCHDYDNDTGDGNDNEGGLTLTYGLEYYDNIGSAAVFNAQDSVLFNNIDDLMFDDKRTLYLSLESAGAWDADRICEKFKAHQAVVPEAIRIEDAYKKYINPYLNNGTETYLGMLYGTKEDQRDQFEHYHQAYMSSKYQGSVCTTSVITLRGYKPNKWGGVEPKGQLTITPYSDIYIVVTVGSVTTSVRAKRGQSYVIDFSSITLNDTEIYVYSADKIASIGSLAPLYVGYCNISYAAKLRDLLIGSDAEGYSNTSLTPEHGGVSFGNNPLIRKVDLQNCPALTQAIDASSCQGLREFYAEGSGITGITFSKGGRLETVELPAVAMISLLNQKYISTFSVFDLGNLQTLWVEYCSGVDTYALADGADNLSRARLVNVNWTLSDSTLLLRLAKISGMNETGTVDTDMAIITGSCYVERISSRNLTYLQSCFPNLDLTYGEIVPEYTVQFVDYDNTVLDTQYVERGQSAENPLTRSENPIATPTRESTVDTDYTFVGWTGAYDTILGDTIVTAVYRESVRQYTVRFYNGQVLLQTSVVNAYERAKYTGDDLTQPGYLWTGWDKDTSSVTSDMDVRAVWEAPSIPSKIELTSGQKLTDVYSPAQIYAICTAGMAENYFAVGDEIEIALTSDVLADESIVMQVYGFNHFRLADGSAMANCVFGMKGVLTASYKMNSTNINTNGWSASLMRTYLNETVFAELPYIWRAIIREVQVLSSIGDMKTAIATSTDKLFLFSQAEVGFSKTDVPYVNEVDSEADNVTFSLFTDNASRIKKLFNGAGSASYWWLRSPFASSSTYFCSVNYYGSSYDRSASLSLGVAFGFCI